MLPFICVKFETPMQGKEPEIFEEHAITIAPPVPVSFMTS